MKCDGIKLYEYLSGKLDSREAANTASHLEECRECRERFRVMSALDSRQSKGAQSRPSRFRPSIGILLPAAAGLLLAVLISIFYGYLPVQEHHSGARALADKTPYPLVLLDTRNSTANELSRGFLLYRDGLYREALAELEKLEDDHDALFFSAISLYMLDEPIKALEKLARVAKVSPKWSDAAEWYRVQVLLQMERTSEAEDLLEKISAGNHPYRDQAMKLLEKLQKQ